MIPQLRVRTEFSFKGCYGPIAKVADALAALQCPAAGIVDGGTWGHVRWAKALAARSIRPLFGTELRIKDEVTGHAPAVWVLAREMAGFYRFSTAARRPDADLKALLAGEERGALIRFAGAGIDDPALFDFIDVNPASPMQQRAALALHRRTGKPLVVTSDNAYPTQADYAAFMVTSGREKVTPQHILSEQELRASVRLLSDAQFSEAVANANAIASMCAAELPTAPLIHVDGDLRQLAEQGKQQRLALGHLSCWPQEYEDRLQRELAAIEAKDYQSYFLVVADLISWAKQRMLVGPGRGSSAGSLLCYLIGITEVDPIPHGLLFERFIDLTRKDLPDIDIDFSDAKRDECFVYLAEKYGQKNVARIGNINTLKPRSVLAEVCKRFGIPQHERFNLLNVLIEYSSGDSRYGKGLEDTLTNTDVGRSFTARYPATAVMGEIENHASHTGVHAAGVIVSNVRVDEHCTIGPDGVAQIDKPDAEALNLLKIDALGLRTLGVIEDAGVVTADQLYALKLNDERVFDIFNQKRYSSIFQFEGQSQRTISQQVHVESFRTIDHLTALARPGPLGGGATGKYIARKAGLEPVTTTHPRLTDMLADTYGVVLYQEQVMRIVREIGKFSWEDTTVIRKAMSGRKGKEFFDRKGEQFIDGAAQDGISREDAVAIWNEICSFGAWGMNKSHTCAYAVIAYWCAWMKCYHPLEFAAACLRNAKDDDQTMDVLRELADEGVSYVAFDPDRSAVNWSVIDGALVGGFMNLAGVGPAKAHAAVAARAAGKLDRAKFVAMQVKFAELYPLSKDYATVYADPYAYGCREGSVLLKANQLPEDGDCLYLGKLVEKERRDENETVRVARRGRKLSGPTLFADLVLKDDTGIPIICRIDRFSYEPIGRLAMEHLVPGEDVLLLRGKRVRGFQMIRVERIKCLTNPSKLQLVQPTKEVAQ